MRTEISILLLALYAAASVAQAHREPVTCVWDDCDEECGGGRRRCNRTNGKVWNIDCHKQPCEPVEGCGKADIVFVFDSSASIGERNWWITKQFAIDIIHGITVSATDSRIGMVTYSADATVHWDLDVYLSDEALEEHMWALEWESDVTNTYDGLFAAEQVFERSARPEVKHLVVLITDGVSNVKAGKVGPQAKRMHELGIEIFVIAIGNVDWDEILLIGSKTKEDHCHYVKDYEALVAITAMAINDTCRAANLTECEEWSEWSECIFDDDRQCGAGKHYRNRTCHFFLWEGGDADVRNQTESIDCTGIECPVSTLEPAEAVEPVEADDPDEPAEPAEPAEPHPECTWTECDKECGGGFRYCDRGNGKIWRIRCNVQNCVQEVSCGHADVVFLLDSSASIGEPSWWKVKQFAMDVTKGLPLGEDKIHVAAVTYSAKGVVQWGLNDEDSYEVRHLMHSFWELPWLAKATNTAEGLALARDLMHEGDRQNASRVVIVMTDGQSNVRPATTITTAQTLHDAGIKVFCIVVHENDSPEFDAIASEPSSFFRHCIKDYDALTDITQTIVDETCMASSGLV